MRVVLFFSIYRRFTGGHLKAWHYFNHVLASPIFTPRIVFSKNSTFESDNPWRDARELVVDERNPIRPDIVFVGGRNWRLIDQYPNADPNVPVLSLVQHVRHADAEDKRFKFLSRKAIRICVSPEVAEAVVAAGGKGPTVLIPNGVDVPLLEPANSSKRPVDLLIAGHKQPKLAMLTEAALAAPGRSIAVLSEQAPREQFLDAMRRSRVTLFLPNTEEGFYLPALEGMAVGTIVVCPDCIGNRSFCLPGINAFRPAYRFEEIVGATQMALALPEPEADRLRRNGHELANRHSLTAEREAFLDVLHNIDQLWGSTNADERPNENANGRSSFQERPRRRARSAPLAD